MVELKQVRLINWYGFSPDHGSGGLLYSDCRKEWKWKICFFGCH